MRNTLMISLLLSLTLVGGCNKSETASINSDRPQTSDESKSLSPEELGELGAKIEKNPEQAQELLSQHGLDEKSFETEIRKITEDPDASKRYANAYEKAKA